VNSTTSNIFDWNTGFAYGKVQIYGEILKKVELGSGIGKMSPYTFANCYALETITVPSYIDLGKQSIFDYCGSLKGIVIPPSTTSIPTNALEGAVSLTAISFPNGLTTIDARAITEAYSLHKVSLPNSIVTLKSDVFEGAKNSVYIPPHTTGSFVLNYKSDVTEMDISNYNITSIASRMFENNW
jgi:hypothetical protein